MSRSAEAMSGLGWMLASNMLIRAVGLAGQVAVGWLLLPEDYGVYALAVSISTLAAPLRNGGISPVVVRHGAEYPARAGFYMRYSLLFNTLAMVVLCVVAAPQLSRGTPLGTILLVMAISNPLYTLAVLYRAKMTFDCRFRDIATMGFGSAVIWQGSIVCFALLGFGPLSFALPAIMIAAFESMVGRLYVGRIPSMQTRASFEEYLRLFRETRWLMLGAGTVALATTGDYFAVAMLTDERTVGFYFFAFQLVAAFSNPLSNAIETVLPPLFTRLENTRDRQAAAFLRFLRTTLVIGLPLTVLFSIALPSLVHFVWQGKWDSAAQSAQVLAACVPAWITVVTGRTLLEARGLWRRRFAAMALYGVGGVTAAGVGAVTGDVLTVAFCVTVYYSAFALLFVVYLCRSLALSAQDVVRAVLSPLLLNGVALALSLWATSPAHPATQPAAGDLLLGLSVFSLISGAANLMLFRTEWLTVLTAISQRLTRNRATFVAGAPGR